MGLTLDTLPEAIVFEICNWLDIFSLVNLSEVNNALRSLANTRSSFWLETLSSTDLMLSFTDPTPLSERDAQELSTAAHRAVMIERNLTSNETKLHSWRYIPWPFELSEGVTPSKRAMDETAQGAIKMHLVDGSGEWMIFVSSRNVIRVVHLRTGKVAAIYDKLYYSDRDLAAGATFVWGVEIFYEGTKHMARMVMSCSVPSESPDEDDKVTPGLAVLEMDLDAANSLVEVRLIGTKALSAFVLMSDVAGPFVVTIIPEHGNDKEGAVTMFRWIDWSPIKLPQLFKASKCCLFEEYFISIGNSPNHQLFIQIVAYPYKSCNEKSPNNSDLSDEEVARLIKIPLPLQSFHIPYTQPLPSGSYQPLFRLCHRYSGQRFSTVHLWIRSPGYGSYNIFTIKFDLFDLRTRAEKVATGSAGENLSLVQHFIGPPETKRVLQEEGLRHYAVATPSGRRYLWWRPTPHTVRYAPPNPWIVDEGYSEEAGDDSETSVTAATAAVPHEYEMFELYTSSTDGLAPLSEMEPETLDRWYRVRVDGYKYPPGSASAKQLEGIRRLPVPKSLACMQGELFLFLLVESCGTALVQLRTGDFWVLRYGKA
ncbi:hypothetical protein FRC18_002787 [Serendipita sp. 400]|nr:hypothetical protein FRC18_002787 [Serendipita sp. 400]